MKKYRGEPLWGVHLFEAANQCAERRVFRSARRRLNRKKQRILLTQEIFAKEIAQIDPEFFTRLRESALYPEDRTTIENALFAGATISDKAYHELYPTIHHLIVELMESDEPHDIRLVYLATAYLMKHRGHFLKEVDKDNIAEVLDFDKLYDEFLQFFASNAMPEPWSCEASDVSDILKLTCSATNKYKKLNDLLNKGKAFKPDEEYPIDRDSILRLLSGRKVSVNTLLCTEEYADIESIALSDDSDKFELVINELGEDAQILILLRALFDWSVLDSLLPRNAAPSERTISKAKVQVYKQHQEDLAYLKSFIRKYLPEKYNSIFRLSREGETNYLAYSYNFKSINSSSSKGSDKPCKRKATQTEFCDYIRKIVAKVAVSDEDAPQYENMLARLEAYTFMPKQVTASNCVIPYQLYYHELKTVLSKASSYLPFLTVPDEDGLTPMNKLLSIFEYRIPYYIGPLRKDNSQFAWIQRRAEGKIYPWNFDQLVDHDASEKAFINKLIGRCSYLPGELALPKHSLLYQEYNVLNELNNLRIDGVAIDARIKSLMYDELFSNHKNVSIKDIKVFLKSNGITGELSGYDTTFKSKLTSYHAFKRLLTSRKLSLRDAEDIIERLTYTDSRARAQRWLETNYDSLPADDIRYLASLKFKDFGRLSRKLLTEIYEYDHETGEAISIIDAMRNTNENLMQLLSDKHSYRAEIDSLEKEYYSAHRLSLSDKLGEMYVPNAVRRPIIRTLDIVRDIKKVCGVPDRIFIEMARGGDEKQKGRTIPSRKQALLELYNNFPEGEVRQLSKELDGYSDRELQREALYLYFVQLGKCMYTGSTINLSDLKSGRCDIDHIYPQSKVKDDSIINNKVLVLHSINEEKKDVYPLSSEIQARMSGYWKLLLDHNLISDEKYRRLTRRTRFSDDEKWNFINRQLVETRQATKALANILQDIFPDSEIVYVKAGLVSDFRKEFDMLKSRTANDLHHAKDAYLNIAVGNVYHCCFSKKWFSVNQDYSIKTKTIFSQARFFENQVIWDGSNSIAGIRRIMDKNNIHLTRYAFCRHGGFFDQTPLRKADNPALIPLKKGLPVEKYGGYNKSTASYFSMVKYRERKKVDIIFMPVDLLVADKYLSDEGFAENYAASTISKIIGKPVSDISFPLGLRPFKINTMFSFDGFLACLGGKANKGKTLGLYPMNSLSVSQKMITYIKHLERFHEKKSEMKHLNVDSDIDKITCADNIKLYDYYSLKFSGKPYSVFWSRIISTLEKSRSSFTEMSLEDQVEVLLNIGSALKSNRSRGCNLTAIGESPNSLSLTVSSFVSNWRKYDSVQILDCSASGIFSYKSQNLLELL